MQYLNSEKNQKSGIKIKLDKRLTKFLFLFILSTSSLYFLSKNFEASVPLFNQQSTASILFSILETLGLKSTLQDNQIIFPEFSLIVVAQCTGIFELISLLACIIAYPSKVQNKFLGIVAITPIIYLLNMIRLIFLSLLGLYFNSIFDIVHECIFQVSFVSLVIMLWVIWINLVRKFEKRD